jgi:hypothetical protein
MKRLFVVLLSMVTVVMTGPSALADQPIHERQPVDAVFVDGSCGFPLEGHTTGYVLGITWIDEDGSVRRFEAYPQLRIVLMNPATGESLTVNISGPAHITEGSDGTFTLVGTGSWFWFEHPDTGAPGLFQTAGSFVLSIDPAGNESFSRVGRLVDLCPELAS